MTANTLAQVPGHFDERVTLLKSDAHSEVGCLRLPGACLYLKHYRPRTPLHTLLFRLKISRAHRALAIALRLQAAGIAVAQPLAVVAADHGGLMYVGEFLEAAVDLKSRWTDSHDAALLAAAGGALGQLHRAGFQHGDCKWSNILCREEQLFFIDLDNARPLTGGGAARDLARFTLNAEDLSLPREVYQEFLTAYAGVSGRPADTLPGLIRAPLAKLRDKHRRRYGARGTALL